MKYLRIVDTESEYNALLASDELQKPYVVLCRETLDLAYGKQTEPDVIDLQIESVGNGQVVVSGFNINLLDSSYARLYYSSTNNFTGALSITLSKYKYNTFKYNGFIPSNSYVKVIVFKGENQTESDVFEYSFTSSSTPTPTTSAPTTSAPTTDAPTTSAPTTPEPTSLEVGTALLGVDVENGYADVQFSVVNFVVGQDTINAYIYEQSGSGYEQVGTLSFPQDYIIDGHYDGSISIDFTPLNENDGASQRNYKVVVSYNSTELIEFYTWEDTGSTEEPNTSAPTTSAPTTDAPTNTSNGITWNWVGETIEVEHTSGGQDYLILYYSEADMPEYTTLAEYVANGYAPLTEDGIPTSDDEKTGLFACEKTSDYTGDVFDYTIRHIIGFPGHLYIAVKGGTLDGVITGKITIPSNV